MRKVVFQMMSSLNGRLDDPFGWVTDLSDDLYEAIDRLYETFDTVLVGRTTYREMATYWPTAASDAPDSGVHNRMATRMNTYRKLVISHDDRDLDPAWDNSSLVKVDSDDALVKYIARLKEDPGKDIHLSGGARLAQTVIRHGLVDEYHFFVHPVVSAGKAWFEQIADDRRMTLIDATPYECGVVGLSYRPNDMSSTTRIEHFSELLA